VRSRAAPPLLAALAALAAGCAHAPPLHTTLAEAGLAEEPEPEGPPPAPVAVAAPRRTASEPVAGPPIDPILLVFAAEARARRARAPAHRGFPEEALRAWSALAAEVDRYLDRPMPQTPLLELARTRIAVEAELEFDRRRYGSPPSELEAALAPLLSRLSARAQAARAVGERMFVLRAAPALQWPLEAASLTSVFGMRQHPIDGRRRMHWGIDLAAPPGRVVSSSAAGYVVQAGWSEGYGLLVEVRHQGDLTSRYGHLSRLLCRPGDAVEVGQPLGLAGQTGRATGPHLHFEVWRGGEARDPLTYLGGRAPGGERVAVR